MATEAKISAGEYSVISAGQFLAFENNSIELSEGNQSVKINIAFPKDEQPNPRIESKSVSGTELSLQFYNFDNANLGLGNKTPIKIGTFAGRELHFGFRIDTLDDKRLRTFAYTFYAK